MTEALRCGFVVPVLAAVGAWSVLSYLVIRKWNKERAEKTEMKKVMKTTAIDLQYNVVFRVIFRFNDTLNKRQRGQLLRSFLKEAIEANGLRIIEYTSSNLSRAIITPKSGHKITEEQRMSVKQWLEKDGRIPSYVVGPIVGQNDFPHVDRDIFQTLREFMEEEGDPYPKEIFYDEMFNRLNVDLAQLLLLIGIIRVEDLADFGRLLKEKGINTPATRGLAHLEARLEGPLPFFDKVLLEMEKPQTKNLDDPSVFLQHLTRLVMDRKISPLIAAFVGHHYYMDRFSRVQTIPDIPIHYLEELEELSRLHTEFWGGAEDVKEEDIKGFFATLLCKEDE
jgi:uncharacterized protein YggL (DUF469 family)